MKKFSWQVVFLNVLLTQLAFAAEEEPPQLQVAQQSSVYRCTEPDGSHTYTDTPCPGEGQRIKGADPSLSPDCQRWQEELDLRTMMLSIKELSPTSPAYMAWLQEQVDACKRKQSGDVDENRSVDENEDAGAPVKGSVPWKKRPTGGYRPSPIDSSHLKKNPPRPLPPNGAKNGRSKDKADSPPPTSYDLRDKNRLPPVRDQGEFGACWAFTAQGAAESNAISQGFDDIIIQRYA